MKKFFTALISLLFIIPLSARAGVMYGGEEYLPDSEGKLHFEGTLLKETDVISIILSFDHAISGLNIWTDSWKEGNFDPVLALWVGDELAVPEFDDSSKKPHFDISGSDYDAELRDIVLLANTEYRLSLNAWHTENDISSNGSLADSFPFEGGIPIEYWDRETSWSLWFEGLPAEEIPEPSVLLLMLSGLFLIRRKQKA